jgi:hypothetical protein
VLVSTVLATTTPSTAFANQDDVPVPLVPAEALLRHTPGWLTGSAGEADLAIYPWQGVGHERWHGRVRVDVAIVQPTADSLVRLGLSIQTIADDRNDIDFRLVRVHYDAFAGYEQRMQVGVAYAGYRHRCSHGADSAVAGRILIRSGPEIGYRLQRSVAGVQLGASIFAHLSAIAQNEDVHHMPRALLAAAGELRWPLHWASFVVSAGFGTALIGRSDGWTATVADRWQKLSLLPLPSAAFGVVLRGERTDFHILAHYQRIMDTGLGQTADPQHLLSLQLGFDY